MNRCLHITIHEGSAAASRHAAPIKDRKDSKDRTSTDPEDRPIEPEVDDPGSVDLITRPDASTVGSVTPRADPSSGPFPSGGSGGYGEVVATACSCGCAPACQNTAAPRKTTPHPFIGPQDYSGFVIVRMVEGIESKTAQTLWELAQDHKLAGLQAVLALQFEDKANGQIRKAQPAKPPESTLVSRPLVELQGSVEHVEHVDHGKHVERMATKSAETVVADRAPLSRPDTFDQIRELE